MDEHLWKAGETVDTLIDSRIKIIQKRKGYRFSIDSLLLADFIHLKKNDKALEFGTGSAVIPVVLQHRYSCRKIIALEIQEELVEMARRTVELNGMEGRIEIVAADVRKIRTLFAPGCFDVVFFNPPYRRRNSGRVNPDSQKALARHEIAGSMGEFMVAASWVLKNRGSVYCIYPARRLTEMVCRMRLAGLEPKRLLMVFTNRASRGEFALVEGLKAGGEELEVLPPLFIYNEGGGYTEKMEALFKGISGLRPSSCG
jgi:tRNA1Val (adenine37-N6)-methyltransferase